jgi:hypothetical protein
MAQFFPYFVNVNVADQIRSLSTKDLLDFWEETQYMEENLNTDAQGMPAYNVEYERAVLQELQIRSCMGNLER